VSGIFGGIEAGGTKFVCAVGTNPKDLREEKRFDTTTPNETIHRAIEYLQAQNSKEPLTAIGIASFGPVDLRRLSPTYGFITYTPKLDWANTNFVGAIKGVFDIPIGFNTDVNAAALGEYRWGAARGLDHFIYLTIGTGIGGGGMINGRLLDGLVHPEMGHIFIPHDTKIDPYPGICPFHHDCFEGLASGTALNDRWGEPAEALVAGHKAWELEAHYISLALVNYILTLSPHRIIIGGGVMGHKKLLSTIHEKVEKLLNNYIQSPEILEAIEHYIVLPALANRAGIMGAIALAEKEYKHSILV